MKDGKSNPSNGTRRVLNECQAEVLDELQVKGEEGVSSMYLRGLKAMKTRLIMDDEYDPSENLSLIRVLTMLERDLEALCSPVTHEEEEDL